jgi:hypothetical protein
MQSQKLSQQIKIKVKGVGQECPIHTGNVKSRIKINVKGGG